MFGRFTQAYTRPEVQALLSAYGVARTLRPGSTIAIKAGQGKEDPTIAKPLERVA